MLASIFLCAELDHLIPLGSFGEKIHKKLSNYGEIDGSKKYKTGDRYRDIDIKKTMRLAIRRGHKKILSVDLKSKTRSNKGLVHIVYAIDSSGSMRGKKIEYAKKAGVALAYKAIESKDKVGLLEFGDKIRNIILPTNNFLLLLRNITKIKPNNQTDFKKMLAEALNMFTKGNFTKHLILLSDAMPTVGNDPEKTSLKEISKLRAAGITVSLVGINIKGKAIDFAKNIVEIGRGRLYVVNEIEKLDKIILEDYNEIK